MTYSCGKVADERRKDNTQRLGQVKKHEHYFAVITTYSRPPYSRTPCASTDIINGRGRFNDLSLADATDSTSFPLRSRTVILPSLEKPKPYAPVVNFCPLIAIV